MSTTDRSDGLRSDSEIEKTISAIKNELIKSSPTPIMLFYPTILDALTELLQRRHESEIP